LSIVETLQSERPADFSLQKNNVETAQFEMKQKYDDAMAAASLKAIHQF
jgi:hypothetical protein